MTQKSPFQLAMQRLLRNRMAIAGALVLCAIALACALLPLVLKLDPVITQPALRNQAPSSRFLFGTDTLGRDLYTRLSTLGDHVAKLGSSLGSAVTAYDRAVGSLESRVLVSARKLADLQHVIWEGGRVLSGGAK